MASVSLQSLLTALPPARPRSTGPLKELCNFVSDLSWNRFDENQNKSWFTETEVRELCTRISLFNESQAGLGVASFQEANALFLEFFTHVVHHAALDDARSKMTFGRRFNQTHESAVGALEFENVTKRIKDLATFGPLNLADLSKEDCAWKEPLRFAIQHLNWKLDISGKYGERKTEQKEFIYLFFTIIYESLKLTPRQPVNSQLEWSGGAPNQA